MDGWITIGTKLDTTKFDKEVSNLENKIELAEKKQELINEKTSQYQDELKVANNEVEQLSQEFEKASQKADELRNSLKGAQEGNLTYEQFLASKEYEQQVKTVDELANKLNKAEDKQESISNKVQQSQLQYEKVGNTIDSLRGKIDTLNFKKQTEDLGLANGSLTKVSKNLGDSIRKAGRLAMSVFTIGSAFALVSRASATLAQYNQQYAADLEYVQYALAQMIAPVLKGLVQLAATLLGYVNYLAQAWFGVNLFANASAKSFASIADSAGSTANSAKEIKKQLAGFDEMTVLGDSNQDSLGGGLSGGGGGVVPDMDLSKIQGDVPEWLKWLGENGDLVKNVLIAIGSALVGLKLADLAKNLGLIGDKLWWIRGLGIGAIIFGILQLVQQLPEYFSALDSSLVNNGTNWQSFGGIVQSIGVIIAGVGAVILGIPTIVTGAIVLIVGTIMKYWDQIKATLQSAFDWFTGIQGDVNQWVIDNWDKIGEKFGKVGQGIVMVATQTFNWIVDIIKGAIGLIQNAFDGLFKGIKGIFDGILLIFKGDFKGGLISIGKGIVNALIGILNGLISGINGILYPLRLLIAAIGNVFGANWTVDLIQIPHIPYLKTGGIVNLPNQGVPVGTAIAGEAGAEGVIPLTDSQAMARLGEAIGRYVTINANITNNMNGRVISRQLKRIQANKDFAYNT